MDNNNRDDRRVSWLPTWCLAVALGMVAACGLTSITSNDSGGSGSSSSGGGWSTGSSGSGSSSDDTSSGASNTSSTEVNGFHVSGTVTTPVVTSLGTAKAVTLGNVTNVLAVNPATVGATCTTAEVASDGSFAISVTGKKPWALIAFDKAQQGKDMFLGLLKIPLSSGAILETLLPGTETGELDIGNISVSADGTAESTKTFEDLLEMLGLDSDDAETIAELDDAAARYTNPDVDGNGVVDCSGSGDTSSAQTYFLDFHVRYFMKANGTQVTVTDLIDNFYDSSIVAEYSSTGVYVAYLQSFSSATEGTVTFVDDDVVTEEFGAVTHGTAIADVTALDFYDYLSFGPNLTSASETVQGDVVFTVDDETLTFTTVNMPTLAELIAPIGRIFPFVRFDKREADCTADCTLSGLSYQWMKKTAEGWTEATLTELDLLVKDGSGGLGFRVNDDDDDSRMIGFQIPETAIAGTIPWSSATLTGVTASEAATVTTTQICHIGLAYDDQIGMRYFQNISNSAGTCGGS